jgi:hypothetical protein
MFEELRSRKQLTTLEDLEITGVYVPKAEVMVIVSAMRMKENIDFILLNFLSTADEDEMMRDVEFFYSDRLSYRLVTEYHSRNNCSVLISN